VIDWSPKSCKKSCSQWWYWTH